MEPAVTARYARRCGNGHTEGMLRLAAWIVRAMGLTIVGLLTVAEPPTEPGGEATQLTAYVVVCAGVLLWGTAELRSRPQPPLPQTPPSQTSEPQTPRRPRSLQTPQPLLLAAALGIVTVGSCVSTSAGGSNGIIALAAVAMLTAADLLPLEITLTIGILGVSGIEVGGIFLGADAGTLIGYPLVVTVGALLGRNRAALRIQAEQAEALLAQNELLRAEQRRADVLDERARIAREIHDVLAHSLGGLGIQLQTVKALFTVHDDPERALEALSKAQRMASEGLTETRRAVHALRTDTLALHEEIARTAAEHAERHGIAVHCETSGEPLALPPEATVALLRIAQESLINAVKHAPGTDVETRVDYRPHGVRVTVVNEVPAEGVVPVVPVVPAAAAAAPGLQTLDAGYGLTGMHERLRLLRGSLDAGVRDGRWVVRAELPVAAGSSAPETASISTTGNADR